MRDLEHGDVRIFNRIFQIYGYSDDSWFQDIKTKGYWSEFRLGNLVDVIDPDSICLDLGANVGTMTLAMAMLAPQGHVYAFEASPETAAALQQTVKANCLTNVSAFNTVLGHSDEEVKFFDIPEVRSSGFYVTMDSPREISSQRPETSQMILSRTKSVDSLVAELNIPKVDFIKIDVEGAELDVLEGAKDTLKRFNPIVVMEFNSYAYTHIREIAPRKALIRILDAFETVYYFKNRTGELCLLENTESAREKFLFDNMFGGFVDDLLCCSRNARLVRTKPGLETAEHDVMRNEINSLKDSLAAKDREIESLYSSSSWRLTAPLRLLKNLMSSL